MREVFSLKTKVRLLAFLHNVQGKGEHLPAACLFSACSSHL